MALSNDPETPKTWHYGLVARYWAEFNHTGPEIAYFKTFVEEGRGPALDVACDTGRLLIPFLRAGLDVDGVDVSEDMSLSVANRQVPRGSSLVFTAKQFTCSISLGGIEPSSCVAASESGAIGSTTCSG